jgi:hypothetical protein
VTAIDYFTGTDTVHIANELLDGGEMVTPIWAVVVDGVPYIRSGYGAGSKWYRRLQRTGRATFIDGPRRSSRAPRAVAAGRPRGRCRAATCRVALQADADPAPSIAID